MLFLIDRFNLVYSRMAGEQYNAVPKGQESSMLLLAVGFLVVIFTLIGGFIAKLWYNERQSTGSRETNAMMDEILADTNATQRQGLQLDS